MSVNLLVLCGFSLFYMGIEKWMGCVFGCVRFLWLCQNRWFCVMEILGWGGLMGVLVVKIIGERRWLWRFLFMFGVLCIMGMLSVVSLVVGLMFEWSRMMGVLSVFVDRMILFVKIFLVLLFFFSWMFIVCLLCMIMEWMVWLVRMVICLVIGCVQVVQVLMCWLFLIVICFCEILLSVLLLQFGLCGSFFLIVVLMIEVWMGESVQLLVMGSRLFLIVLQIGLMLV